MQTLESANAEYVRRKQRAQVGKCAIVLQSAATHEYFRVRTPDPPMVAQGGRNGRSVCRIERNRDSVVRMSLLWIVCDEKILAESILSLCCGVLRAFSSSLIW